MRLRVEERIAVAARSVAAVGFVGDAVEEGSAAFGLVEGSSFAGCW